MSQPESTRPIKPKSSKIGVVLATLFVLALFGGVAGSIVIGSVSLFDDQEAASETDQAEQTNEADTETTGAGGPIGRLFSRYMSNSILSQMEQQATLGSTQAMVSLGYIYEHGNLGDEIGFMSPQVEIDFEQAADWYEMAMEAGESTGTVRLALLHTREKLKDADPQHGWWLLEQAAIGGKHRNALYYLYARHSQGPEDPHYDLFKIISYAEALFELGEEEFEFCANYFKVQPDLPKMMRQKGADWMVDAAAKGDRRVHLTLARLYEEGVVVPQSNEAMTAALQNAVLHAGDYYAADWLSYHWADLANKQDQAGLQAIKWGYIALFLRGFELPEIRQSDYFDDVDVDLSASDDDRAFGEAQKWFEDYQAVTTQPPFITDDEADIYCH